MLGILLARAHYSGSPAARPAPAKAAYTAGTGPTVTDRGFRQGLKEAGYSEGENVAIEYRWAESQLDRLPALAGDLVRKGVAVIVAGGGSATPLAAKAVTTAIPVVFNMGDDPVKLGLVTSLSRPGGNLTGVNFFAVELTAKRLELLRELVPAAARIAVLVNPANPADSEPIVHDAQAAARAMGLQILVLEASSSKEIDAAFATLARERPDALLVGTGPPLTAYAPPHKARHVPTFGLLETSSLRPRPRSPGLRPRRRSPLRRGWPGG